MKVNVEELSPIERKLSIEVESARVSEELDRAYAVLGRQVKIAGFRPGKVPRRILEQRFKHEVEGDVIRRLVEHAYLDAIREHHVEAVSAPQVTPQELKPNAPFSFQARVEVKPQVEPKDYRGLALKRAEVKVDDQMLTERLERLREDASRLEPVERTAAQRDDHAVIDYEATVDGQEFPGSKAENITVQVIPGELVDAKIMALEGVQVGETKEIDYVFPPDYRIEQVRGKTGHFRVHLKGLKVKVVPELNDEFAQEVEAGQTLEGLKARIRSDLEKGQRAQQSADERDAILRALVEKNPIEVPRAMVERAIDQMLEGVARMMARSGVDPRAMNMDVGRFREDLRERAVLDVKGALLIEAIAGRESIHPSSEDVDKRIEELAEESKQPLAQVHKIFRDPAQRQHLEFRMREEKTIEFLKAHATYS